MIDAPVNDYSQPVIIGAGPAGLACSLKLAQLKIKHILIEKDTFPRDKICGDALSGKVLNCLKRHFPEIHTKLIETTEALPSHGISFISPNGNRTDIPFRKADDQREEPPGLICSRLAFDNLLFEHINSVYTTYLTHEVGQVEIGDAGITIYDRAQNTIAKGSLIISAEGARALVAKAYAGYQVEQKHYCAGLRQYYKNVAGMHPDNYIELHFIDSIQPGYFWIFPMTNGWANVGMGMLTSEIAKKDVNIKKEFSHIIAHHPILSKRFIKAEPIEKIKGWSLPLGSKKRTLSGNRFMLTGDAASFIDPFTGEGIANALISGIEAAEMAKNAQAQQDYSASFLKQYDKIIYAKIWPELKMSSQLQKVSHIKPLFNWVVNRANTNDFFKETLIDMFNHSDLRKKLINPLFYFKLLVSKN